jgi:phage tail tape-measure protein
MAQKLETNIIINLAGNLAAKAKRYGNSMGEFARKNERSMKMVRMSTAAAGRGIDRLGNRYVGLAATLATGAAVRGVGNFEEQMTRIGTNAKLTDDQVKALTKSVENVSNQDDVRIDTTQIAAGVDALLGKTGDLEFTMDNLQNMGQFMQAFGADAESTGALFAQFREKGVKDAKEVMNVLDQLYGQFAVGSVSVKDLAGISEQLFATYQAKGPGAITQMGALVQLIAKSKGNANEALTSIQGIFATFSDKKKVEFLDKQGIKVFKDGTNELRQPVELLLEVLDKAKNDPLKLGDVFDQTSLQGLASLYSQENKLLLKDMVSGNAELGATQKAAAKNAATFNSAMTSLNNSFSKFANEKLSGPIKEIADAINGVDQETVDSWLKWGEVAVWAIGGVIAAKKTLDAGMWAKKTFGAGGIGGAAGKGGMNNLGATPVYVVNMGQGGFNNGGDPSIDSSNNQKPKRNRLKTGLQTAAITAGVYPFVDSIMDAAIGDTDFGVWAKETTLGDVWNGMFGDDEDNATPSQRQRSRWEQRNRPSISEMANNLGGQGGDVSAFATQIIQNIANPAATSPLNGQIAVDVQVSDDRVRATARSRSPFISIDKDPDAGQN